MIDEIRKRLEAATQRPLILGPIPRECYCDDSNATFLARVSRAALEVIYDGDVVNLGEDEEADFIYHAPADIAYLLKRVEQLEAVRRTTKDLLWALDNPDKAKGPVMADLGGPDPLHLVDQMWLLRGRVDKALAAGEDQPTTGKEE